jgi:hypothetical protein
VCGDSFAIPCPDLSVGISDAEAFTPAADFTLMDAQVLVYKTLGSDADFNVYLDSNAGGKHTLTLWQHEQ